MSEFQQVVRIISEISRETERPIGSNQVLEDFLSVLKIIFQLGDMPFRESCLNKPTFRAAKAVGWAKKEWSQQARHLDIKNDCQHT